MMIVLQPKMRGRRAFEFSSISAAEFFISARGEVSMVLSRERRVFARPAVVWYWMIFVPARVAAFGMGRAASMAMAFALAACILRAVSFFGVVILMLRVFSMVRRSVVMSGLPWQLMAKQFFDSQPMVTWSMVLFSVFMWPTSMRPGERSRGAAEDGVNISSMTWAAPGPRTAMTAMAPVPLPVMSAA